MKKVTLLFALCLVGILSVQAFAQVSAYRYTAAPMAQISRGQTVTSRIHVTDNFQIADVRVAVFAKTVMYSSLRVELISPTGTMTVLKDAQPSGNQPWYGPLGTQDSYCLFRDGGIGFTNSTFPNDGVYQPLNFLSLLNTEQAQGWWTLKIIDVATTWTPAPSQDGKLVAWELYMNKVIQEPEQVLFDQTLVGSNLVPQISGRSADGAIIPNWHGDVNNACSTNLFTLGKNGDCFPFIISGVPGNIGDLIPPLVTPGRFEIQLQAVTNYPNGPVNASAFTSDIAVFFGQAVENFAGSLPTPPVTYPNPTVAAQWPTGPVTTTNSLYPGPEGINGGVRLVGCPSYDNLHPSDNGGFQDVTFSDNALIGIEDAGPCGGFMASTAGICGIFQPKTSLSTMNGARAVNGLYYVTVYDTYGDAAGSMKNSSGNTAFGQVRVLSLRLRYLVGGGNTPSPTLHQGIAGPLKGIRTPGFIDGAVLGYRTSVGNTIPPYSYHGIKPTTNPLEREPILYFTNVQKMYQGNSVGYLHEELINTSTGAWGPVGNHGPFAFPGALDDNQFDPTVAGVSTFADVLQIANGSWKIRHKLVQARYDADPTDNEFTGPEFTVTPNTFAYYKDKVPVASNPFTDPGNYTPLPINLTNNRGVALAFTLFQFPSTKIVSVDYLMDEVAAAQGITPQSDMRITIWPSEFGLTGEPSGPAVGMSTTVSATSYIPGANNWRTFPIYHLTPNGGPDVGLPGIDLPPGTYFVTLDNIGTSPFPLFPYSYGQAPVLSQFTVNSNNSVIYAFNDFFGPIGPTAAFGAALSYLSGDPTLPPDGQWYNSTFPLMDAYTLPMKLNMDYKNDFAVDFVTFDGVIGNESVALPNAPFAPVFNVSSRSFQDGQQTAQCNIQIKIYQGDTWQSGDYISNQVVTLTPFASVPVQCPDWSPAAAGDYTVEAIIAQGPNDYNLVNNAIKFHVYVSSSAAIIVAGNNAGSKIDDLRNNLLRDGHAVEVMDMNDAKLANVKNAAIYVVGDVANAQNLTSAARNGNTIAFANSDAISTLANSDKVFQVERTSAIKVGETKLMPDVNIIDKSAKIDRPEPIKISASNKEELLQLVSSQNFQAEDVKVIQPSDAAIKAMNANIANAMPAVKNSPFGDLKFYSDKYGNTIVVPSMKAATKPQPAANMFVLEQNYPNPFNPSTVIAYTLNEPAQVTMRVLDVLGKEVATIVNDSKAAGSYSVSFNGLDMNGKALSSGTYMYRIDVTTANGTQTATKTMTLSK